MNKFKNDIKRMLVYLACVWPLKALRALASKDLICVNYHSIKDWDGDRLINGRLYRSVNEFEKDILFLKKHYTIVDVQDVIRWKTEGKHLPPHSVLITIDDGLKVVYDQMFPVLRKYNVRPVLFVNPDFVDNKDLHYQRKKAMLKHLYRTNDVYRDKIDSYLASLFGGIELSELMSAINYAQKSQIDQLVAYANISLHTELKKQPIYVSTADITEMQKCGWAIGAHSLDHPPYGELSIEEQVYQTLESIKRVHQQFNTSEKIMAYPSNDKSLSKKLFEQVGHQYQLSFGVQGLKQDDIRNHINRIELESSSLCTKTALKYEYMKYIIQRLVGRAIHHRTA